MPDIHVSMLALHVPNVLPKTVPWIDFARHKGIYINHHSAWPRHAGRLILEFEPAPDEFAGGLRARCCFLMAAAGA